MRFTVTGATGFVGTTLVNRLLAENQYVNILGRSRKASVPSRAAWAAWNALAEEPPMETINNADVIINLAGEQIAQRWTDESKKRMRESRVLGTRNLVRAIAKAQYPPKVLISASAIGYYGDRGDEILTESSRPGNGFLPELCLEWENEAKVAEASGVRVIQVRIGVVLGLGGGALAKMIPAFRAGVGGRLGSGRQWMSWIHIHDLVNLFLFSALKDGMSGPVNGTSPEPVRNSEFTETLGSVLHRPAALPVPVFGLKLLMGEMSRVVLDSQRVLPQKALDAGFTYKYPTLRPALENLFRSASEPGSKDPQG